MARQIAALAMTLTLATTGLAWAGPETPNGNDTVSKFSRMFAGQDAASAMPDSKQASGMINTLTDQLGVSKKQAIGGSGALLGLAKNQLGGEQFSQLTDQVPGLGSLLGGGSSGTGVGGSMLSGLSRLSGVQGVFSSLGLSAGMMSQFAPVMLDYLGNQGVGQGLLGNLGDIWSG